MLQTDILRKLVSGIISHPDLLRVEPTARGLNHGYQYTLTVSEEDHGKVIGKKAQMIKALQTLFRYISLKTGEAHWITVGDSPFVRSKTPKNVARNWNRDEEVVNLLRECLDKSFCTAGGDNVWNGVYTVDVRPAGGTTILVVQSDPEVPEDLWESLLVIFKAWGKSNGRFIDLQNERK